MTMFGQLLLFPKMSITQKHNTNDEQDSVVINLLLVTGAGTVNLNIRFTEPVYTITVEQKVNRKRAQTLHGMDGMSLSQARIHFSVNTKVDLQFPSDRFISALSTDTEHTHALK